MDLLTYFVILAVVLVFDGIGVYLKASFFTAIGTIVCLYGEGQLVNSGAIVLHTAYNGGFQSSNAPTQDYLIYVVILVVVMAVSGVITIDLWNKQKGGSV